MNKALLFVLSILISSSTFSQSFNFSKEIGFAKYLQDKDQLVESILVLNSIDTQYLIQNQKDSLHYEIGWFYYTQKNLDSAILHFKKISENDPRKLKTTFFIAYFQAYLKQYKNSELTLNSILSNDTAFQQLKNFQLAGNALLKKDFNQFNSFSNNFKYNNFAFENEEKNFVDYKNKLLKHTSKSPFIAATLSAIIPGAGKWYAGKKKEGFGAFLPIISAGLLTLEGYNRGGLKDARFLIFGTLFTTFYIGNIWGSAIAVKVARTEYQNKYENKILFDLHIPLRNIFN